MLVLLAGLLLFAWLFWTLNNVLLPFVLGLLLAYMVLPVMRWLENRLRWKNTALRRGFTIFLVYLVGGALLFGVVFYGVTAVTVALRNLVESAPQYIMTGLNQLHDAFLTFRSALAPDWQIQVDEMIASLTAPLASTFEHFLSGGLGLIKNGANIVFGFLTLPVFLFFVLKDWERLQTRFYEGLPAWTRGHVHAVMGIFRKVAKQYIGAMLILSVILTVVLYLGLAFMNVPFALALASFCGLMQFLPFIGPWLAVALCVVVLLAVAPDKLGLALTFILVVQMAENLYLVPRIQGRFMNLNPAILIVVGVTGAYVAGVVGFVVAIPLAVFVVDNFRYWRAWVRAIQVRERIQREAVKL
jgi:predicted PurR-regulated permease PerM